MFGVGLSIDPLLIGAPLAVVTLLAGFAVAPLRRELPARKEKPPQETFPFRWSRVVQAHPWRSLVGGTAVLLALAAPVLSLRLGFSDEGNFSETTTTRRAYDLLAEGFGPGFNGPLVAAITLTDPADADALTGLVDSIGADRGVQFASPARLDDPVSARAALVQIVPTTSPQDETTTETIERLRNEVSGCDRRQRVGRVRDRDHRGIDGLHDLSIRPPLCLHWRRPVVVVRLADSTLR